MATPFPGVSGGTKDAYNFYHSQLRINIECAFGRLVHRWSILRSNIPQNTTIAKTTAMVIALAKLHNFCIREREATTNSTPADAWNLVSSGAVPMEDSVAANMPLPLGLLNSGHHFEDMDCNARRRRERAIMRTTMDILPRDKMHTLIATKGLTRPAPTRDRH
jgi:DDE superfamily endonuclease